MFVYKTMKIVGEIILFDEHGDLYGKLIKKYGVMKTSDKHI
jgi:hypothetical protein